MNEAEPIIELIEPYMNTITDVFRDYILTIENKEMDFDGKGYYAR